MTAAQRAERHRMQLLAAAASAGDVPIEITADGVRLRDDLPVGVSLTLAGFWTGEPAADDEPIPFGLAS